MQADLKPEVRQQLIAKLNDKARQDFANYTLTNGVRSLDGQSIEALLKLVKQFNDFNENNDPHGEHDFGSIVFNGTKYFFKIDYYDWKMKGHSQDPVNPFITKRVITVMEASEY